MSYVGAYVNGERPKSKKALREAFTNAPESVKFDSTGAPWFGGHYPQIIPALELEEGVTYVVVGPDPYSDRRWYGNVVRGPKGWVVK